MLLLRRLGLEGVNVGGSGSGLVPLPNSFMVYEREGETERE